MDKKNYLLPLFGGLILFFPYIFVNCIPFIDTLSINQVYWFFFSIIHSLLISFLSVFYKNSSIKESLIKTIIYILSFFLTVLLNRFLGTINILARFLNFSINDSNGNSAGIGMFFFLVIVFVFCFLINFAKFVKYVFKTISSKKQSRQ